MSNKKLTILSILAVLMVVWAVVQSRISNRSRTSPDESTYLIQGLDPDDIGSIILGVNDDAVTLKRRGRKFVVASKDNYPAKTSEINNLLSKCLEIKTQEFVTDNPANHEDLEVTEDKARNVVKFMTPEPNSVVLAGVAVGKTEELGKGTYVRLLSNDTALSNKVYVASSSPWFSSDATSYLEQELISVKRENIESVMTNSPSGPYTLKQKEGSQDVVLENIPAGKTLKSSDAQSVFTALTSLRFDDVMKKPSDLTFDKQYLCRLKDSTVYALSIAQKDDKTYVLCSADFTDTTPVEKAPLDQGGEVESEEELKKKEAILLARDEVKKFSEKHQGWVYEIPDWKAKNLTKALSELVEDEEKPAATDEAEDPNAAAPIVPFDATAEPVLEDPNAPATEDPNTAEAAS
jgi:hypothetical protein